MGIFLQVVLMSGGGGGGGGGGSDLANDNRVKELAQRVGDRMPGPFDLRKAHSETFKVG